MNAITRREVLQGAAGLSLLPLTNLTKALGSNTKNDFNSFQDLDNYVNARMFEQDFNAIYALKKEIYDKSKLTKSSMPISFKLEIAPRWEDYTELNRTDIDTIKSALIEKRVFYDLLAIFELVSVQSLIQPAGLIFFVQDKQELVLVAKTRKYKTCYNYEAVEDLKVIHGLDPTEELIAILGQEISLEIVREIINDLKDAAQLTDNIGVWELSNKQVSETYCAETGYWHVPNMKPYRWLVIGPNQKNIEFHRDFVSQQFKIGSPIGMHKIGYLQNKDGEKIHVYLDHFSNDALLGVKWDNHHAGYIYAPYCLCAKSPTVLGDDFVIQKRFLTRYNKVVHPQADMWYSNISCGNKRLKI